MYIGKGTVFRLGTKQVVALNDTQINVGECGYFILNFWEQCDYPDIEVLPVTFVKCEDEKDLYVLKRDNVILGSEKDICLA